VNLRLGGRRFWRSLPEGHILPGKGTNFKVSYKGGNGNDMTLTVVP